MTDERCLYGLHSVKAALKAGAGRVVAITLQAHRNDQRMTTLVQLAERASVPVRRANRAELDRLAGCSEHQGAVAIVRGQAARAERDLIPFLESRTGPALLLVLDEVQDPHNLGACLRSADAAGVDAVIVPVDNSAGLTPVVHKVAAGAAESVVLFRVTNLQRALERLKEAGVWLHGAAGEATQSLYDIVLDGPVALVMGAEGRGLRRLTRESCDTLFRIPMHGQVSSLNVSVATGIALFEACRQREAGGGSQAR